jgi:hypothetical protein
MFWGQNRTASHSVDRFGRIGDIYLPPLSPTVLSVTPSLLRLELRRRQYNALDLGK